MRTLVPIVIAARQMAPGMRVVAINPSSLGQAMDPILQCDAFRMSAPFFPPHPHAGFSAVTYMLPRSSGSFINRDSLGDRRELRPGSLHWTEAARGMLHEEVPMEPGVAAEGLQIFVDIPTRDKLRDPSVYHVEPEHVPVVRGDGFVVRVLAGEFLGEQARFKPLTDCALWDVAVAPGAQVVLPVPSTWNVSGVLLHGGGDGFAHPADPLGLACSGRGEGVMIEGGGAGWNGVIIAGLPINEPRVFGGPFVMATEEQLEDAKRRFGRGEMGALKRSF